MFKAVIFDFDGVLFDSQKWITKLEHSFFVNEGLPVKEEDLYYAIGTADGDKPYYEIYHSNKDKIKSSYDIFKNKMQKYINDHSNYDFNNIIFPATRKLLIYLSKKGYKVALASSSDNDYIKRHLRETELENYFEVILTGDQFKEAKPNPEIYECCIKKLAIDRKYICVVEDSTNGIKAAKRADLYTFAIKDKYFGLDQSMADIIVEDLTDLFNYL